MYLIPERDNNISRHIKTMDIEGLYYKLGAIGTKVLATDLDWTLVRSIKGRFPKDEDDWAFLPNRITTLQSYRDAGYTLVIFTNQGYKGKQLTTMIARIRNIVDSLAENGIKPWVFAAIGPNSSYRKPSPNMWKAFRNYVQDVKEALYVGDAAGRPEDFSSDDKDFATASGLGFRFPEAIFPNNHVNIPATQTMFIFVGMPGSGKTYFYENNLKPLNWVHAHQDTLKTQAKVLNVIKTALSEGKSVAIDATNPSATKRRDYIDLAIKYQVPTMILYFVRNGYEWNKLRPNPVPKIAYSMYYKNLVEPSLEVDGVPVVEIS